MSGLGVEVVTSGHRAVVTVRGDVDGVTAPTLGGLVSAVLDHGHRHVTLDAAGVEFMNVEGVQVIADTLDRLDAMDGQLVISAPSLAVTRILDIVGLAARVRVDAPQGDDRVAASSLRQAGPPAPGLAIDRLRHVAAIPANRDVIDAAFALVVRLIGEAIGGADGVSVSLRRQGRLATVAATDDLVTGLDHRQYDTGQGPCVEAARAGRQFLVASARTEQRWPAFMPHAVRQGITSILSTPLVSQDGPVGSINVYTRQERAFDDHDGGLASSFATTASTIVTSDALSLHEADIATRLQQALRARETIAHAQGVLMGQEAISAEHAYSRLRHRSQATSQSMVDLAGQIIQAATHAGDDV